MNRGQGPGAGGQGARLSCDEARGEIWPAF
jgi:hypothetical protein